MRKKIVAAILALGALVTGGVAMLSSANAYPCKPLESEIGCKPPSK